MFDKDFPNTDASIGLETKTYKWANFSGKQKFTSLSLPCQGKLGNCYWISPLTSIYKMHPELIRSLITGDLEQSEVRFCIDGQYVFVTVDHTFPIKKNGKPAFTRMIDDGIWAMILEKAYAKIYGSYKNVSGGFNRSTLKNLTSAPTNKFRTKDVKFKFIISDLWNQGFPICCNSKKNQPDKQFANNHAYSIIDVSGDNITVRNPWGKKTSIKTLSKDEFIQRFASIECCYYTKGFDYIYKQGQDRQSYKVLIKEPGVYFFSVDQKNKRWFRSEKSIKYKISPARVSLISDWQILSQNKSDENKELWCSWQFKQQSEIIVTCTIDWKQSFYNEFVFSVYGKSAEILETNYIDDRQLPIQTTQMPIFIQRDPNVEQEIENIKIDNPISQPEQSENQQIGQVTSFYSNILNKCIIF